MSLPNPGMSFTPFDPLTAAELNALVENIEALAAGTGLDNTVITGAKLTQAPKRFVPLDNVEVLSTDPVNTNYTDCDVTAFTSANCYAVQGVVRCATSATARSVSFRKNGSSDTHIAFRTGVSNTFAGAFQTEVDSGQIFEWAVSDADVANFLLTLTGYWETYLT